MKKTIKQKKWLLALFRSTSQTLGFTGISLSSPTLASAISNLMPALTFILATLFRFFTSEITKNALKECHFSVPSFLKERCHLFVAFCKLVK